MTQNRSRSGSQKIGRCLGSESKIPKEIFRKKSKKLKIFEKFAGGFFYLFSKKIAEKSSENLQEKSAEGGNNFPCHIPAMCEDHARIFVARKSSQKLTPIFAKNR